MFKRTDSDFERGSTVGKTLSSSTAHYREIFFRGKISLFSKLHFKIATASLSKHHTDQSAVISFKARTFTSKTLQPVEGSDDG